MKFFKKEFLKKNYISHNILENKSEKDIYQEDSSDYINYNQEEFLEDYDLLKPNEIYNHLNDYVMGQNSVKKLLSVALYNHFKRIILNLYYGYNLKKSNILMIGPSGSGKTFLIQILSKMLNIPVVIVDATTITEAGYIGEDVEDVLQKLFQASNYEIESTEIGIVYIDEIDKISKKKMGNFNKDVSGEGVQHALLKIIEGTFCSVSYSANRKNFNQEFVDLNTENILFICGGAFYGLDKIISDRIEKKTIGFGKRNFKKKSFNKLLDLLETEDLIKFGLIPELIGRLPMIGKLEEVNKKMLKDVLINSKDSFMSQYNLLFAIENIEIFIEDEAIEIISKKAINNKTGVRGLKSIMDEILLDVFYEAPNLSETLREIIIHKNVFDPECNGPLLVHYNYND